MRAILFTGSLDTGGTQKQIRNMAHGLAARGHHVKVVTIFPRGQHWQGQVADGVSPSSLFARRPRQAWRVLFDLLRAPFRLRKICVHYDVVYSTLEICNVIAWFATIGMLRKRLVWGDRSADIPQYWKRRLPFMFCRLVSSSVPLLISNSSLGQKLLEDCGFSAQRMLVIRNGIDTEAFYSDPAGGRRVRREWNVAAETRVVGIVGRVATEKGHDVFLKAAAGVLRQGAAMVFVCVGEGAPAYVAELQRLAQELGITKHIIWAGLRNNMREVYNALDVCCSASHYEGFPNVLLEAMACGVPCVSTDVGDVRAILGELGIVVPPADPNALAGAIMDVMGRDKSDLKAARAHRIRAEFPLQRMLDETELALASVCANNK